MIITKPAAFKLGTFSLDSEANAKGNYVITYSETGYDKVATIVCANLQEAKRIFNYHTRG